MIKGFIIEILRCYYSFVYILKGASGETIDQVKHHFKHLGIDNSKFVLSDFLPRIITILQKDHLLSDINCLLVGSANLNEINIFKKHGFINLTAIDLVSLYPEIKVMDMHKMSFSDGTFDLVYTGGAFHCTKNPQLLADEFSRVVKKNGFLAISVPINYQTCEIYSFDAKTPNGMCELFSNNFELIESWVAPIGVKSNPHDSENLRIVLKRMS